MSTIKICGLTRADDARAAADLGADLLGLVFHRSSPRFVSPEDGARLTKAVSARWIGVFVDAPSDKILRIADAIGLYGVQLHGDEPPSIIAPLRQAGLFVIRAHRIARGGDLRAMEGFDADADLLDTFDPKQHGGTGRTFDWRLAAGVARERRVLLAGGLDAENVRNAIRTVRPWGIDVSSGVESGPGHKDPKKVARFIDAARATFSAAQGGCHGKR